MENTYISKRSVIIGNVTIGKYSSMWPGAVIRGDIAQINIGNYTSVQDNCVFHCGLGCDVHVGNFITAGHGSIIHGAIVDDCCIIGMGSILMDGVKVGKGTIVAAGAVVKDNTIIPPFSLAVGNPAIIKENKYSDYKHPLISALVYYFLSRFYIKYSKMHDEKVKLIFESAIAEAERLNAHFLSGENPSSFANLEIAPSFEI